MYAIKWCFRILFFYTRFHSFYVCLHELALDSLSYLFYFLILDKFLIMNTPIRNNNYWNINHYQSLSSQAKLVIVSNLSKCFDFPVKCHQIELKRMNFVLCYYVEINVNHIRKYKSQTSSTSIHLYGILEINNTNLLSNFVKLTYSLLKLISETNGLQKIQTIECYCIIVVFDTHHHSCCSIIIWHSFIYYSYTSCVI